MWIKFLHISYIYTYIYTPYDHIYISEKHILIYKYSSLCTYESIIASKCTRYVYLTNACSIGVAVQVACWKTLSPWLLSMITASTPGNSNDGMIGCIPSNETCGCVSNQGWPPKQSITFLLDSNHFYGGTMFLWIDTSTVQPHDTIPKNLAPKNGPLQMVNWIGSPFPSIGPDSCWHSPHFGCC